VKPHFLSIFYDARPLKADDKGIPGPKGALAQPHTGYVFPESQGVVVAIRYSSIGFASRREKRSATASDNRPVSRVKRAILR
jgi:hypothetical protein